MKIFIFFTLILLSQIHVAVAARTCFTDHVSESFDLNSKHYDEYSRKSFGKTNQALSLLMASEVITLPVARYFDYQAAFYHKNGIDLFCQEFVPMSHREIRVLITQNDKYKDQAVARLDLDRLISKLDMAVKYKNQPELLYYAMNAILEIEETPRYGCLLRHLVESIYRIAYFMPLREVQSYKAHIKSPVPLMWKVISNHISSLSGARFIDRLAFDAQKNGVSVLCADLPDLLQDLK